MQISFLQIQISVLQVEQLFPPWQLNLQSQGNYYFVIRILFIFRSSLICPSCDRESNTFDPFLCVSLPIPQIQVSFKKFPYACDHSYSILMQFCLLWYVKIIIIRFMISFFSVILQIFFSSIIQISSNRFKVNQITKEIILGTPCDNHRSVPGPIPTPGQDRPYPPRRGGRQGPAGVVGPRHRDRQ